MSKDLAPPLAALPFAGICLFAWVLLFAQPSLSVGTTTFVLDGNRIYAELGFVRPDGSIHRALAFVDMGSASMTLRESLIQELQLDEGRPLVFKVGELSVSLPRANIVGERRAPSSIGADLRVEGMLAASVLQKYQVVIDYEQRTLALAKPGTLAPKGTAVPFHINYETGLIAVDTSIDGKPYRIAIDNGSAYSWLRQSAATRRITSHPDWVRGVSAVGPSNMMMSGDMTETSGTLLRIPELLIGQLILKDVGVLAAGPGRSPLPGVDLFDWYSTKNAVPVIGWIGGNVLGRFRVTIDYPNQEMYWLKQREADPHELDQVGLTLRSEGGVYLVAAVATKNGKPTVDGVLPGDRLIRVGELDLGTATWGAIYSAMHGISGQPRSLVLERGGHLFTIVAPVTAF